MRLLRGYLRDRAVWLSLARESCTTGRFWRTMRAHDQVPEGHASGLVIRATSPLDRLGMGRRAQSFAVITRFGWIIEGVFLTEEPRSHFHAQPHVNSILVLQKEDRTPPSGQSR